MAKTSRRSTKTPSKPPARKSARPIARSADRARPAAARAPTKAAKPAKPAAKNAKEHKPAGSGRRRSSRVEVKVGSLGGGLGFLSGKPGSSGAAGRLSDKQPRLTRTKLSGKEMAHFRDLLLAKRRQLLGDMETMENEALRTETSNLSHLPVHMADMGTDNYEQEFTLSLVDRERKLVDEIDRALTKVSDKTYGICEGTGQMITAERLEAQPWARYSIEWARHMQRPGFRR